MEIKYTNVPRTIKLRFLTPGAVFCELGKETPILVVRESGGPPHMLANLTDGERRYLSPDDDVVPLDAVLTAKPRGTV